MYTTTERVEITELFFSNNQCAGVTTELFNQLDAQKHFNRTYVLELMAKFRETGSVLNKIREAQRSV